MNIIFDTWTQFLPVQKYLFIAAMLMIIFCFKYALYKPEKSKQRIDWLICQLAEQRGKLITEEEDRYSNYPSEWADPKLYKASRIERKNIIDFLKETK